MAAKQRIIRRMNQNSIGSSENFTHSIAPEFLSSNHFKPPSSTSHWMNEMVLFNWVKNHSSYINRVDVPWFSQLLSRLSFVEWYQLNLGFSRYSTSTREEELWKINRTSMSPSLSQRGSSRRVFVTDEEKLSIIQYFITKCPAGQSKLLMNGMLPDPRRYPCRYSAIICQFSPYEGERGAHVPCLQSWHLPGHPEPAGPPQSRRFPRDRQRGWSCLWSHLKQVLPRRPLRAGRHRGGQSPGVPTLGVRLGALQEIADGSRWLRPTVLHRRAGGRHRVWISLEASICSVPKSETEISIIISGEAKKLRSFWSGKWISHYTLAIHDTTMDVCDYWVAWFCRWLALSRFTPTSMRTAMFRWRMTRTWLLSPWTWLRRTSFAVSLTASRSLRASCRYDASHSAHF